MSASEHPHAMTEREVSSERVSEERLLEIIAGCEGVTPGPYRADRHFSIGPRSAAEDQSNGMMLPILDVFGDNRASDCGHFQRLDPATVKAMAELALLALRSSVKTVGDRDALLGEVISLIEDDMYGPGEAGDTPERVAFNRALRRQINRITSRLIVAPKLSAIEAPSEGEEVAGSDKAAIEIADAVISWMVRHDLLDADLEYQDDDIIAVLDDLSLPAAASEVTEEMVEMLFAEMDRRMGLPKNIHQEPNSDWLPVDDTQIGVEFAVEFLTAALKGDRP